MQSEAPAPVAVSAPPAAAEASKAAAAPPAAAAAEKHKKRQSLSIPKGAQEVMAAQLTDQPPAGRSASSSSSGSVTGSLAGLSLSGTSAAAGSATGSHQGGLPQVGSPPSALRELPALRDAPPNKREELFKLKLQLCGVIFSFDDPTSDKRGKVCAMSARTFHFCVLFESYHCLCVVRSENTRCLLCGLSSTPFFLPRRRRT